MTSNIKTFFLLLVLTGLLLFIGRLIGGNTGLTIALGLALVMNVGSFWFSDKIVLKMYGAEEIPREQAPMLHQMVEELSKNAGIPKPKVCIIPDPSANAFATGRNPEHAVVAVTEGILRILSPDELRGVVAHEIAHIANRDIAIQGVVGVLASAVMYMASMAQWGAILGTGRSDGEGNSSGGGIFGMLLIAILAPLAATLVQMSISRSREYHADKSGAKFCGNPKSLASALGKLTMAAGRQPMQHGNEATAHMFIVNPFMDNMRALFSTHPPIEERIHRLESMKL